MPIVVPPYVEDVIRSFDSAVGRIDLMEVASKLGQHREKLQGASESDQAGAWAEVLAFALVASHGPHAPWRTYFGPRGSGTKADGTPAFFPDIAEAPPGSVDHWAKRALTLSCPVLVARYADLCWDLSRAVAGQSPDIAMARLAIDMYIAASRDRRNRDIHEDVEGGLRAFSLAQMTHDDQRTDKARALLLDLHQELIRAGQPRRWTVLDRLMLAKDAGLSSTDIASFVRDLEAALVALTDTGSPSTFDPHHAKEVAERLRAYYKSLSSSQAGQLERLDAAESGAFKHAATLADPMLASMLLQSAIAAARGPALRTERERLRLQMEEKIEESRSSMQRYSAEIEIPVEEWDKQVRSLVGDNVPTAFARICSAFIERRSRLEAALAEQLRTNPLTAMISQNIMSGKHVRAVIGSIRDDPEGRLIQLSAQHISLQILLPAALERAMEMHGLEPEHFAIWITQSNLFEDRSVLVEGLYAWRYGDLVKAISILVPQVEVGLRALVESLGKPTTKAHPRIHGASIPLNLGDMLGATDVKDALGPDLTLHLLALYSDPRGLNLRNDVAHGQVTADDFTAALAASVVHSLMALAVWKELAGARSRVPAAPNP